MTAESHDSTTGTFLTAPSLQKVPLPEGMATNLSELIETDKWSFVVDEAESVFPRHMLVFAVAFDNFVFSTRWLLHAIHEFLH